MYRQELEGIVEERTIGLKRALEGIIQTMARTVEARDPYTAGHQERVARLAFAIATEMGLPKDQAVGIRMAGIIHDLGKISVPSEILSKPTTLSDIEFALIKTHPRNGHEILAGIDFPWPVAQMVLQHHEKINGSGYPLGLTGENILLEARVLCVADVVEAMASHRPYRPALGVDVALGEIEKNKGVFYDNTVVDVCLRMFRQEGFNIDGKD
jgi:HD-GYP domain-containing protein (c-di-GMP phosphodiesterase class II)